jgi:ATP-dependent Clp protease ATP-binding subunit ClpA
MFEGLTEKARRVVLFAELAARRAGETQVGLEHLLLALTHIEPGLWRTIGGRRGGGGIALVLRAQFHRRTVGATPLPPTTKIVLSEDLKKALSHAVAEAKQMRSEVIGTDHLFLGLLKTGGEGWMFKALGRRGITYETARARILEEAANPRAEEPPGIFGRYTEGARRVIFFARYEAGIAGAGSIGPEHLVLGLVREDKPLWRKIAGPEFNSTLAIELRGTLRKAEMSEPASVDMPVSGPAKAALGEAELEAASAKSIETRHLLLGLLKNGADHPVFEILKQHGITYERARANLFEETGEGAGA